MSLFGWQALPQAAAAQLSGVVVDGTTGEPIADARVTARALGLKTRTDARGEFYFTADETDDARSAEVAVAAVGYYIASAVTSTDEDAGAGAEISLERVPLSDSSEFSFPPEDACDRCHEEIYLTWKDTAMAKSGQNTWVNDIYNGDGTPNGDEGFVYTRDSKFKESNPNSECAACHQPERWIADPGAAVTNDPFAEGVSHGISCSVCHRIASIDVDKVNYPGFFGDAVEMTGAIDGELIIVQYGPLDDVTYERPIAMRPSYQPQASSDYCAACHQDKNDPDEDGKFEEDNGVISEPTYLEWAASSYADPESENFKSCADCHMKTRVADSACSEFVPTPPRAEGELKSHTFEGTTPEYLENAVTLSLEARQQDDAIEVIASIHNDRTGHHVPTGVTIRNMILLIEATDADGEPLAHVGDQVVHELGGVGSPDEGYYAGLPGKLFGKINQDEHGKGPVFYTEATGIESDNRIPAGATDVSRYRFRAPASDGEVEVRARLIYRRSWRVLVDAKQWTEDGHGNELEDLQPPHFGHLMEQTTAEVEASAAEVCTEDACMDAGAPRTDGGACKERRDSGANAVENVGDGGGCRIVGFSRDSKRSFPSLGLLIVALLGWRRLRRTRL